VRSISNLSCFPPMHRLALLIVSFAISFALTSCGGSSMSVPARQLTSISVQPANGEAVVASGTVPFSASGTFDQPPTAEDSLAVAWSTSDTTIATIDASGGAATCIAAGGPVTITGSLSGKKGTATLTCVSAQPVATGNCVYVCGSTRCGALTGYCSFSDGNACHQAYDPGSCPVGKPANGTATDSCGVGIDNTRSCTP
jgi:hypothetical protein